MSGAAAVEVHGVCPPRLERVREAFVANFAEGLELGARFCLAFEGEVVVDLWGGFADRASSRPFDQSTLTPIFSTTKALSALMIARLVDQEALWYDQPVREIWPEFAQAGKASLTVEQVLSHQAGLCGFPEPMDPDLWFDWEAITTKLAAMAPLWPPGTASGYHPATFGYLAGEMFRRADGRTIGLALNEDIAGPLGLDVWIGLPEAQDHRVADVRKPPALPDFGALSELKRIAFLTPWASPPTGDRRRWRRAEIPSANGHATAEALARLMAILACDGMLSGKRLLAPGMAVWAGRERISGPDLVMSTTTSWAAGFLRSQGIGLYGPGLQTFGHSGWGGSCAFADPERRLSGAYVMNRQSAALIDDPRPRRLIEAAYAALS